MKLKSFNYLVGLIIIFLNSPLLSEEQIDIWKNKKKNPVTSTEKKNEKINNNELNLNSSQTIETAGKIEIKDLEESAIKRLRKEPDQTEELEETEEETNDDFENLYKGQISKSGVAILPSKRTRRIPEIKKPSLADEAISELKAEQPEIKEENLDTEESPLELSEEVPSEEENKTE